MSNHSSDLDKEMFAKLFESEDVEDLKAAFLENNIGKTGNFPEGKLTKHDEGEIQFAVGMTDGKVVLEFGTPVTWIGFPPDVAEQLGRLLIKRAKKCRKV